MYLRILPFLLVIFKPVWMACSGSEYPNGCWPSPECDQKYLFNAEIVCTKEETEAAYWGDIDHCMSYTLHWFATTGNISEIERILKDCTTRKLVDDVDDSDVTPLWTATWLGHYLVVEKLLENSADICTIGYQGYNLLQAAKENFCYWHRGVSICGKNKFKWIPLDYQKTIDILEKKCTETRGCHIELDKQDNTWICCPGVHKPCALARQPGVRLSGKKGVYEFFNVKKD